MQEVIDRMQIELSELNTRLVILIEMLNKDKPHFIDNEQWALLNIQKNAMVTYQECCPLS